MVWPGGPTATPPQLTRLQIPASPSDTGLVDGQLEVPLVFIETFSYFDQFGNPAVGTITYESSVEAQFSTALIAN
jgi:hypothetical protein